MIVILWSIFRILHLFILLIDGKLKLLVKTVFLNLQPVFLLHDTDVIVSTNVPSNCLFIFKHISVLV